jgi:predicted TIM-barrel enzyme
MSERWEMVSGEEKSWSLPFAKNICLGVPVCMGVVLEGISRSIPITAGLEVFKDMLPIDVCYIVDAS